MSDPHPDELTVITSSDSHPQSLGEYELRREIGRGGMGVVYEAWHPRMGRRVAVKTLVFGPSVTPRERARFDGEVQSAARLQHPGIATVFEAGETAGRPFYSMEFVEGGSLVIALHGGPWESKRAAKLIRDAAIAVDYAHQQGVIHRDLKPGNILLDGEGHPKIVDFGLAKRLDSDVDLTRTGQIMGTPAYMAPEQAMGLVKTMGAGVDIYALGAILYEMLTGRPPFQSPDPIQTLSLVATADPIPPRTLQPSVARDLEVICLKCLHKTAARRYLSAQELADDLDRYLNGQAILARPVSWMERTWKWMKRRPAVTSLIVLAVVFVVALFNAYLRVNAALTEAEENLWLTYSAVEKLSVELSDALSSVPESEGIRAELLDSARELYEELARVRPRDDWGRFYLAATLEDLGTISRQLGRSDEARSAFHRSLEQYAILLESHPHERRYRMGAAAVHNGLSTIAATTEERIRELELARDLMPEPTSAQDAQQSATTHHNLSLAYLRNAEFEKALRSQYDAIALREQLHDEYPDYVPYTVDLAVSHTGLAQIHFAQEDVAAAGDEYRQAVQLLSDVQSELDREGRFIQVQTGANLAACLEAAGDLQGAAALYTEVIPIVAGLSRDFPRFTEYQLYHARLIMYQAYLWEILEDMPAAIAQYTVARDLSAPLAEAGDADAAQVHALCEMALAELAPAEPVPDTPPSPETTEDDTVQPEPADGAADVE